MQSTPAPALPPPDNVSIPEAARRIGVCRRTLYTLINENELRAIKVRRRRLVPVSELKRFSASRLEAHG